MKKRLRLSHAKVTSGFWQHYRELIDEEVLPYQWQVMNDELGLENLSDPQNNGMDKNSHAVANLKIAAGEMSGHHYGFPFQDTDVYKWLEAAAYTYNYNPNSDLRKMTDELIDLIDEAQEADGYLSTYFQIDDPERKFKRLAQSHELYTMGHYIEAGVAYYQATGNQKALNIAIKMADCIDDNFGNDPEKISGVDGHPEIELALSRLYEITSEKRYLDLAYYFLNERGRDPEFFQKQYEVDGGPENDLIPGMYNQSKKYYQVDAPIKEKETADGHAVRMVYLCTGMAYVAKHMQDKELLQACRRYWNDIVKKRMYITGNIGSTTHGEAFTFDYDLPNDTIYGEICASVGMSFFAKQMLEIEAKGEYGDVLEKELFNGALAGMALDGKHFFYVNPLEADPVASENDPGKSHVLTQRADWFGCACCPANLTRLITSIDQYLYTVKEDTILIHQFVANETEFSNQIKISQQNNYPWEGDIKFDIANPNKENFNLGIRIPGWSIDNYELKIDGVKTSIRPEKGFIYISVSKENLSIELSLNMQTHFMRANNRVKEDYGQIAVQRGPIIYCAEEADNTAPLWVYKVALDQEPEYYFDEQLLNGIGVVNVEAEKPTLNKEEELYFPVSSDLSQVENEKLTLVPYYSWANREEGQMRVWFQQK